MCETLEKHQEIQKVIEDQQQEVVQQQANVMEQPLQQEVEQVQQAPIAETMETQIEVNKPAEPISEAAQQKAAAASKKPCFGHKHRHEPAAQPESKQVQPTREVLEAQARRHRKIQIAGVDLDAEAAEVCKEMNEQLKNLRVFGFTEKEAIKSMLDDDGSGLERTARELNLHHTFQVEKVRIIEETLEKMPLDSKVRKEVAARREKEGLVLDRINRGLKAYSYPNPQQKERELATLKRHDRFDFLKKIFRRSNSLSHQDAEHISPDGKKLLVNQGRAYFGGTKPMYIFKDQIEKKDYLYKEAVNCIGIYKPEGALVTEAAAKLQKKLRGDFAIPAWAIRDENGKVLGSMQEKLEQKKEGRVDLFDWQINPGDSELSEQMKSEVLKEHTLDWLLCNFDTKGENFLHRTDGHLSSFDKEASFSFLKDKGSEHMSATYKPHSNQTIYNVMFQRFANDEMDLDLNAVKEPMEIALQISEKDYKDMFADMLDHKYGKGTKKRAKMEKAILDRRDNLKQEYENFFTKLLEERKKHVKGDWRRDPACKQLKEQEDGSFRFQF